jgi:peptide/nickel transport system substrate-binding protein
MVYKRFVLLSVLLIVSLLLAACPQPEAVAPLDPPVAQQPGAAPGDAPAATAPTGEVIQGGVFVEGTSDDPSILNPILSSGTNSSDVHNKIYPALIGQDPFTGEFIPSEVAESWEVSDDGLVWTFTLRDDVLWSDGEAVDSADFKFTFDAIASDLVESPRKYFMDTIESIEAPDPQTVIVTYNSVKCDALGNLTQPLLPSHLYAEDFSDIMTSPENEAPSVSAGPVIFQDWTRDESVTTLANPDYFKGAPNMEGWIYREIPDPGSRLAELQTGSANMINLQPEQITAAGFDANSSIYRFEDDGYDYIALNLANPDNPQPGLDEEGNPVEQDPHPILGDKNVRQAIAYALDYDSIINQVYLEQGYRIAANVLPAIEWAYNNDLVPYPYDPEMARQLLEEAGWVDENGDGVREKDGVPLALNLLTNAGNTTREDLGVLVDDQLGQIGFDITFEAIEFGSMLTEMDNQTFDMVIIGWTGLGADPNDDAFWSRQYDTPGSGFNFVSYSNDRVEELLAQGVSVPGCDPEERAPYYKEIQEIIYDELPYIFVRGRISNYGYTNDWQGINPGPWSFYHNMEQWSRVP